METDDEVQRLTKVYEDYRESHGKRESWDSNNPGNKAISKERQKAISQLLQDQKIPSLEKRKILEIGCGMGNVLASLITLGATAENLYGVDLLPDRIEKAKQQHPGIHFEYANAESLNYPDASFDLVLFFTVFSSILDERMRIGVAQEAKRVLKRGGGILWYDLRYNNPGNPSVRGLQKKDIQRLFPEFGIYLQTITLLPPLARRLGPLTDFLYPFLERLPFLRTHYAGLFLKN